MASRSTQRGAFTLLEIMVAVAILAFAFIPILTHSQATLKETEDSQEALLARHYLMDITERYRGSHIDELKRFPASPPSLDLGKDEPVIEKDSVLNDRDKVAEQLAALTAAGYKDGGAKGFQRFVDAAKQMKLSRLAWFKENARGPGKHEFTCRIRWQPKKGTSPKEITMSKIIVK